MTALIVDDEVDNRQVIVELLKMLAPDCRLIGEADNVDTAYDIIQQQKPELVFLDIHMPKGNGFTLLKRFEKIEFEIIFVTSHDQYAIDAIRFNALDYILKPIDMDLFKAAVDRARKNIRLKTTMDIRILNLIDTLESENQEEQKIVVHLKDQVLLLRISEIMYLEGDINYTHVHTEEASYMLSKTLKEFEDFLADMENMVRIHRKYIVNSHFIRSYTKSEPFLITLSNGIELEASRRKKSEVLSSIKRMTGK